MLAHLVVEQIDPFKHLILNRRLDILISYALLKQIVRVWTTEMRPRLMRVLRSWEAFTYLAEAGEFILSGLPGSVCRGLGDG